MSSCFTYLGCFLFFATSSPLLLADTKWDSFTFFPPLKTTYHPVSTHSKEAQEAFDKGLTAIYAFNYDEAVRSFDKASQHDPHLAMAYWGMALALDETLDSHSTLVHVRLTSDLCQKALSLSDMATPQEKAYIQALTHRFSNDPHVDKKVLRTAFSEAMWKVVQDFPEDLDATTLYAESLMDLDYWDLWEKDGKAKAHTAEILRLLESVLQRNPYHLGANHYYIHALENSPYPERALFSSYRLTVSNVSEWGHLLHTPSHIFLHVGYYEEAVETNLKAIEADKNYIKVHGLDGKYPLKYLAHNLTYLTMAYLWQERFEKALETAEELTKLLKPFESEIKYFEYDAAMVYEVLLYFHRWNEILDLPKPQATEKFLLTYWTFAQALAFVHLNNLEKAVEHQIEFEKLKDTLLTREAETSFNSMKFWFANAILQAAIAQAQGDHALSIQQLQKAVGKQTNFFDFTWFHPISQSLGAELIQAGRPEEAEKVFKKALQQAPLNGRLLFGLSQALKAQDKDDYNIMRECRNALIYSTKQLSLRDL